MEEKRIENGCLINKNRVVGANASNKDGFFTLWFHLTNLCYSRVGIYKKDVEKPSTSTNKRDTKNGNREDTKNKGIADVKSANKTKQT